MKTQPPKDMTKTHLSPFERIKRTNDAGNEYWSSRDFAKVLAYGDYRNFEQFTAKARTACFNSGQRIEDHFVDVTEMVEGGKGSKQPVKSVYLPQYGCRLGIVILFRQFSCISG